MIRVGGEPSMKAAVPLEKTIEITVVNDFEWLQGCDWLVGSIFGTSLAIRH